MGAVVIFMPLRARAVDALLLIYYHSQMYTSFPFLYHFARSTSSSPRCRLLSWDSVPRAIVLCASGRVHLSWAFCTARVHSRRRVSQSHSVPCCSLLLCTPVCPIAQVH